MGKKISDEEETVRAKFVSATVAITTVLILVVLVAVVEVTSEPTGKWLPLWPLVHIASITVALNAVIQETDNLLAIKAGDWQKAPGTLSSMIIPIGVLAIAVHASDQALHWTAITGTAPSLAALPWIRKLVPLERIIKLTDEPSKD